VPETCSVSCPKCWLKSSTPSDVIVVASWPSTLALATMEMCAVPLRPPVRAPPAAPSRCCSGRSMSCWRSPPRQANSPEPRLQLLGSSSDLPPQIAFSLAMPTGRVISRNWGHVSSGTDCGPYSYWGTGRSGIRCGAMRPSKWRWTRSTRRPQRPDREVHRRGSRGQQCPNESGPAR